MDKLVLYDSNQYRPMIQAITSPSKRISMVERIENIEYKRYVRIQAETYFYFISYYWSFLGVPVGYVVSQVVFVIGIKGTPGATAAIATTLGAATSNVVIQGANTAIWGAYKTLNFFTTTPIETPQLESYDLGKVAGNTVEGMSSIIDTIIPHNIRYTTMMGMIVLCIYLHYIIIDWINRSRFAVKQSIA
jgi:hypothetical protein